ncbi:MAG TPA: tyrosine-type recombinase/integrase [Terriglobales bacterium]|nr:tyrosine-type recombinase/integrase [Terriglobales bacterium]
MKPDYVKVDGQEQHHPEGSYYLDYGDMNGKRQRPPAGKDAADAENKRKQMEQRLAALAAAKAAGIEVAPDTPKQNTERLLVNAVQSYLDEIKLTKKLKTHQAYKTALDYFLEGCKKPTLDDIERKDLVRYRVFLRDKKNLTDRTAWNKFSNLMTFLKAHGVRGLARKEDWPQYVEEVPEVYDAEELDKFFAECTAQERLYFEFFLMTGMREQEVMHQTWKSLDFTRNVVRMRHLPKGTLPNDADYEWKPKAYKEREIRVPQKLMDALKKWKSERDSKCPLLFPTRGCRPKMDFLDVCKAVARRAELDDENFWLHKFRATFATTALRKGNDLTTVQHWLGHSDLASTMRYLRPNDSPEVQEKVESMWETTTAGK